MNQPWSKRQRFSIRKFSVGVCSVLVGAALFSNPVSVAAQETSDGNEVTTQGLSQLTEALNQLETWLASVADRYEEADKAPVLAALAQARQLTSQATADQEEVAAALQALYDAAAALRAKPERSLQASPEETPLAAESAPSTEAARDDEPAQAAPAPSTPETANTPAESQDLQDLVDSLEAQDLSVFTDNSRAPLTALLTEAKLLLAAPSTSPETLAELTNRLTLAQARLVRPSASQATQGVHLTGGVVDSNLQYPQTSYANLPVVAQGNLTGWKNDQVVSQISLKTGNRALTNVRVELSDFVNGNQRISKDNITAHFIKSVEAYTGMPGYGDPNRPIPQGSRQEATEVLYGSGPVAIDPNKLQNVWLTIKVPGTAGAGRYTGTIRVLADNLTTPLVLPYTLDVADASLPNATDFKDGFDIELWQNPFAVADYYGVEPFSERHFEILRPHMEKYKALGGHAVTTTVVEEAWAGQTYGKGEVKFPSMVEWTKKADGSFTFDYTKFDKWVEFNQSLGLGDKIVAYGIAPWTNEYRYFDEASGTQKRFRYTVGNEEYNTTLRAFLENFMRHSERKGWRDKIYIGIDERGFDKRTFDLVDDVLGIDGRPFRTAGAMDGFVNKPDLARRVTDLNVGANAVKAHPAEFEVLRQDRAKAGLRTTIYTATGDKPGSYSLSAPGESYWTMMYAYAVGGQGYLRWAYDSWVENPLVDSTHNAFEAGDTFLIFPDERTAANPVSKSSLRLEKMAEGVRDVNKLIVMRKEVPALGAKIDELLATIKPSYPTSGHYLTPEGKAALAQDMAVVKNKINDLTQEYLRLKATGTTEVTSVAISAAETSPLYLGATRQLTATVQPANVLNPLVTWTSSNPNVASVSDKGVVTGLKPGRVVITATSQADPSKTSQLELIIQRPQVDQAAQVAYYSFDNPQELGRDSWGNRHGQATGGSLVEGRSGQALQLAAGQKLTFAALPNLNHDWSVGYWVNNQSEGNGRQTVFTSQDGNRSLALRLSEGNGKSGIHVGRRTGDWLTFQHTAPKNEWVHYTWTNSSTDGLSLYVNGRLVQTNAWTKTNNFVAPLDVLGGDGFAGLVDEVKIYNRALTASEVAGLTPTKGLNLSLDAINLYIGEEGARVDVELISDLADQTVTFSVANPEIASVDANGQVTALAKGETRLIVENAAGGYRKEIPIRVVKRLKIQHDLPVYKMPEENLSDIEKSPGTSRQYLAHPDMILLDDDKTLITAYPVGHGHGPLIMKVSRDGGETWTEKTDVPTSWATSWETPTLYKLDMTDGSQKLILITGMPNWHGNQNGGWQTSLSTDNGETWSEYKLHQANFPNGQKNWSIVAMSSLVQLKDDSGQFIDKWMGFYIDAGFVNYRTYLTFDENGQEQWSAPEKLIPEHRDIEQLYQICELGVFRSPDGNRLVALGRSQSHHHKSVMFYSDDEGKTWSRPEDMQGSLQGERHKIAYDPISGRLLVTFREIILDYNNNGRIENNDWMAGEWVAWVGTYDDLMNQNEGEYRILLAEDWAQNAKSGDTGYAGVTVQKDGTFILNSYGHFDKEFSLNWKQGVTTDLSYIKQAKFKLGQVDQALGRVNKSALNEALTPLEQVTGTDYTPESYQAFTTRVAAVRAIHDSRTTQQVEIDRAMASLATAPDLLVRSQGPQTDEELRERLRLAEEAREKALEDKRRLEEEALARATEKARLEKLLEDAQKALETARGDKTDLTNQLSNLTTTNQDLIARLTAATNQLNSLQADKTKLVADLTAAQGRIETLAAQLANIGGDSSALTNQLTAAQTALEAAQAAKTRLEGDLAKLTTANQDLANRLATATGQVTGLTGDKTNLTAALATAQDQIDRLTSQLTTLSSQSTATQGQLTAVQTALETSRAEKVRLETELANLRTANSNLAQDLAGARGQVTGLEDDKTSLTAALATAQSRLETLTAQLAALSGDSSALLTQLAAAQTALETAQGDKARIEVELVHLRTANQTLAARLEEADRNQDSLRDALDTTEEEKARLAATLATLTAENGRLTQELAASRDQVTSLEGDKTSLVVNLATVQDRLDAVTAQLAALGGDTSGLLTQLLTAQTALEAALADKTRLEAELSQLQTTYADLAAEKAALEQVLTERPELADHAQLLGRLAALETALAQAREDQARAAETVAQLEVDKADLERQLAQSLGTVQAVNHEVAILQAALQTAQASSDAERAAHSQTLERLTDALADVSDLTERLNQLQAQLAALNAGVPDASGTDLDASEGTAPSTTDMAPGEVTAPASPESAPTPSSNTPATRVETGRYRDETTGVQVQLSGDDKAKTLALVVQPKGVSEVALESRLSHLDLDLYDIYFVDESGQRVQITDSAQLTLPVRGLVDGVYYIAPTGLSEALPFTQVDANHVTTQVTHFSYYGVVYKPVSQPASGEAPGKPTTDKGSGEIDKPGDASGQQPGTRPGQAPQEAGPSTTLPTQPQEPGSTSTQAAPGQPNQSAKPVAAAAPTAYGQSLYGGQAQPELTKAEPTQLPETGDAAAVFATATGLVSLMAGLGLAAGKKKDD